MLSAPPRATRTTTRGLSVWNGKYVRLPVWDGKLRTEPGAYKGWKREIKATRLTYDIEINRSAPLLFLATKDDGHDLLSDLDAV